MADFPQGRHSSRISVIPARALDDSRLGSAPLKLLSVLGTYSDRDGWCWPSITTLAKRMGVHSRQAIQKHLTALRDLGYLRVQHQVGGVNKYRILHDVDLPPEYDRMAETDPANVGLAPPRQRDVATRQREVGTPRQRDVGIEPTIEPKKEDSPLLSPKGERKKRKAMWPDGLALTEELSEYAQCKAPGCDPPAMWDQFENHHRAKGSMFVDWKRAWFTWVNSPYEKPMNGGSHERSGEISQAGTHTGGKHKGPASFVEASREVLALRSRQS